MAKVVFHSGKVIDHILQQPLIGAHIVLADNPTVGTTTDFDGNFQIQGYEGEKYLIGHIGYSTTPVTLKKNMAAATYRLSDNAIQLDEFVGRPKNKSNYALGLLAFGAAIFIGNKIFN